MILDPYGRILSETWKAEDCLVVAHLDLDLLPLCTGRRWTAVGAPNSTTFLLGAWVTSLTQDKLVFRRPE
jgi:hypothetical protein